VGGSHIYFDQAIPSDPHIFADPFRRPGRNIVNPSGEMVLEEIIRSPGWRCLLIFDQAGPGRPEISVKVLPESRLFFFGSFPGLVSLKLVVQVGKKLRTGYFDRRFNDPRG